MKKIFFMAFAVIFGLMAIAFVTTAQAAVTCGAPGTEGMPTCNTLSTPNDKCCVPPYYKGIKTVAKTGTKTTAMHAHPIPSSVAEQAQATATVTPNVPAAMTPKPIHIVPTASAASEVAQAAAPTAPAAMAPAAPATPSVPAPSVSVSVSHASGAKASK